MADRPLPWGPPPVPPLGRSSAASWIATIAIACSLVLLVFGGYVVGGNEDAAARLYGEDTGETIEVVQGVTLTPTAGWAFREQTANPPGTLLEGNGGILVVTATTGATGPPTTLLEGYLATVSAQAEALTFTHGAIEPITIPAGPGAQASYAGVFDGAAFDGAAYSIVSQSGLAITVDGYAAQGQYYPLLADQVGAMVGSMRIV